MRTAVFVIGGLLLLGITFYIGKKIDYWRYVLLTSRKEPKLEAAKDEFPGVSANELVAQALVAERAGHLKEASKRFLAAKHRDLRYRGILFRVGKMAYDSEEFEVADKLLERAIAFGENVDASNYFRGLIALRRDDYAGAQQFFRAAAAAGPFVADYPFFLAEALRRDHHPNEAKPFYTQAALVSQSDRDDAICQFKIRLARLEAGEGSKIGEEIKERQKAGPLPVEWLLTAAALAIRDGRLDDVAAPITEARAANAPDLFGICMNDFFFVSAAGKSPQLAALYGSDLTPERQLARPRRRKPIPPHQP